MMKLLFKSGILVGLLFLITLFINWIDPLSYSWGSIQLNTKIQFLKEKNIHPKAYFIGSSNTLRHVIPSLFNKTIGKDSSYAFNLGVDGTLPPKTFHVIENLIKPNQNIDYIFLELNGFEYLPEHYFIPTRRKYYYKFEELWMSYNYLWRGNLRLKIKLGMTIKYMIAYVENAFKIGMRADFIKFIHGKNVYDYSFLGGNKDGYYPLPEDKTADERMKQRLPTYLANIEKAFLTTYTNFKELDKITYNKYLKNLLLEQLKQTKAKGIELIFILNPIKCEFHEPSDLVALFYTLPKTNRIDMANPLKYPEFYQIENRWDEGHFNDKGARVYTEKLATAFNELSKQDSSSLKIN